MTADSLRQAHLATRLGHGALNGRFMQVNPCWWTEAFVAADATRREDKLPRPVRGGVRILALQRVR